MPCSHNGNSNMTYLVAHHNLVGGVRAGEPWDEVDSTWLRRRACMHFECMQAADAM